jgi:hypothetical protein
MMMDQSPEQATVASERTERFSTGSHYDDIAPQNSRLSGQRYCCMQQHQRNDQGKAIESGGWIRCRCKAVWLSLLLDLLYLNTLVFFSFLFF